MSISLKRESDGTKVYHLSDEALYGAMVSTAFNLMDRVEKAQKLGAGIYLTERESKVIRNSLIGFVEATAIESRSAAVPQPEEPRP